MKYLLSLLLFFQFFVTNAQSEGVRQKEFNVKKGIGLEGYDPVSYFEGKPKEGAIDLKFTHKAVSYLFSSTENLTKFKSSPEKYEPAYGGWCAFAMGKSGEKVKIDPKTYKIKDGKLYLFYNFWGNNTLTGWNKNETKLMEAGDRHWDNIVSGK